ncbi:MAG: hypothetical protein ACRDKI_03950 [Solirubrobacterales bacterium]
MNQFNKQDPDGDEPRGRRRGHRGKTGQIRSARQLAPSNINRIRVRTKRRTTIDEEKIALAYFLLAKKICEDRSEGRDLNEESVIRLASELDDEVDEPRKESS